MSALKEVEVVKKSITQDEVLSNICQKKLWYPYTVKRLINCVYNNKTLSADSLDFIIVGLEHFCHCLSAYPEITPFNISEAAKFIICNSDSLKKEFYSFNKNYDFDNVKNTAKFDIQIKKIISRIELENLNLTSRTKKVFVTPTIEANEDFGSLNAQELKIVFLKLIEQCNFCYSDILTKIFIEADLDYLLCFRNDYRGRKAKKNNATFLLLLQHLNNIISELYDLFKRNNLFLFRMIETELFSKEELKSYFLDILISNEHSTELDLYNYISEKNKKIIVNGFMNGLLHTKEYYVIEFSKYNNYNFSKFKSITIELQLFNIKNFCSKLENASIYFLYNLSRINDKQVTNYTHQLDTFIEDLHKKNQLVLITRQKITFEQKELILNITLKLQLESKKYHNICLNNLAQIGRILTLLTFDVKIKSSNYHVKLVKNNKNLMWQVFSGNEKIINEVCVSLNDLERINLILAIYSNEKETKHKLVDIRVSNSI